ncbi:MAG: tol-pal system protein YbgF [Burkholderiales bacterium]|nr:tol-pal system protein YbgF [Burkholderiales bacterium]MCL4689733.1 tol-pal system protein YbgF [Burkholderiales bacterium]
MRASSTRLAVAAFAAAAGLAHAGLFDDDEARKRIEDMRAAQEKGAKETGDRLARIEESIRNIGVVELLRQIETLNAEIARLRGANEVLANQVEQVQKRQRDFYLDLDSRLKRVEGVPAAQPAGAPDAAAPPAVAAADPAAAAPKPPSKEEQAREVKAYDAASGLFRRNDFASAAEAFRAFLKEFPQSALAPNATYWIGICQAALKDYKGALATQEGLISRFPQSPKAPDALLAIAAMQAEQGDQGSARNTLEDIIARYPASEAAGKARTRLAATRR